MGWGGIVARGLIGAAVGAAESARDQSIAEQKQQMEIEREKRLSSLRVGEHQAIKASDIAAETAAIGPKAKATSEAAAANADVDAATKAKIVGAESEARNTADAAKKRQEEADKQANMKRPGFRYLEDGVTWEIGEDGAPKAISEKAKAPKTQDEIDLIRSQIRLHNAQADAAGARAANAGAPKEDKSNIKLAPLKDENGLVIGMQDINNPGWRQVAVKGEEAVPAKSGFLGFGKSEGTPAKPGSTKWVNDDTGEELVGSEYQKRFYPTQSAKRGLGNNVPAPEGAAAPPAAPKQTAAPTATPNAAQIDMLKKNPSLRSAFEQKFGAGSAAQYLGR